MYYVYEFYNVDTGEIIYVGKGKGKRYKVRNNRNKLLTKAFKELNIESRIVEYYNDEKDAFEAEYDRINALKKQGQCTCNIHVGGAGGSGEYWTDELRKEYSENNIMKNKDQRERMSKNNPMKNKSVAEKVVEHKRIHVIIDGVEYNSISDVCKKFNVRRETVNGWFCRGKTTSGKTFSYKGFDGEIYTPKNDGQKKPVIYKDIRYESATDASKKLGFAQTTISRWCRNGRDPYGNPCRYEDDTRKKILSTNPRNIPVIINGVWYQSKSHASRKLNISIYFITKCLNNKNIDNKYICEYGNQQPSQENFDKSILEGSTTNR